MALSPMMTHYLQLKEKYKDCILFYRLGDFYEMFFEDAEKVSSLLDLVLTGKDCGLESRAPMCGIPFHAAENYIGKLVLWCSDCGYIGTYDSEDDLEKAKLSHDRLHNEEKVE